jgi:acyl-CoA thioesterase I
MGWEKAKVKKLKLLAIAIACIVASSGFFMLFLQNAEDAHAVVPIRVACVGDSITWGSGYPAYLQAILGKNYTVENFGVSGSAVLWKSDKPYVTQLAYWNAITYQPDIVVIMLGTNDASEKNAPNINEFSDNYMRLIHQFQALRSAPQVYLVDPPPILNNTLNLSDTNLIQEVIPRIEQVATKLNLPTINMHSTLLDYPEYFGDGVHPNSDGGELIANTIGNVISTSDTANYTTENYR